MRRVLLGIVIAIALIGGVGALMLPPIKGPIVAQLTGGGIEAPSDALVEDRFSAASDYHVSLFATDVPNVRFMRFSPGGDLLVSQPRKGAILHVLRDTDGDGRSDGQRVLIDGLDRPHGLDFRDGFLYVGETGAVARVRVEEDGPDTIRIAGPVERIVDDIPPGGGHWARTLRFGPDGGLYVHVGSSCNVCEEEDPRRAALLRYEPDGSGEEIYASGLRNAVGMDWQPGTNQLFMTDNGRDLLGDEFPPCELNRVERGGFYGWPYANGFGDADPDFGPGNEDRVAETIPPAHGFRAHNAPLGITFLRHPDTPEALRDAALVALHGSWNRSTLDGYKVVSLHWNADGSIEERDFLTGFELDEDVIGRPVDVIEGADGSIFVTDDYAGAIFRLQRGPRSARPRAIARANPSDGAPSERAPLAAIDGETLEALDQQGLALFETQGCGGCHLSDQAIAGVVVKPLVGLGERYSLDSLTGFFLAPTPPMPAFDLPEPERRALAVHLLSRFE